MSLIDHVSLFHSLPIDGDVEHIKRPLRSLSPSKRKQRIVQEQLEAAQERVAREVNRKKIVLDEAGLGAFRSPGYYMKEAREKYQRRTLTSVSSGRSSPFRGMMSVATSQRRSRVDVSSIQDSLPNTSLSIAPETIIPSWISQRQDFPQAYQRIKASRLSDIETICRKDASARTHNEKIGLVKWAEGVDILKKRPMEILDRLQTVSLDESADLPTPNAFILLLRGQLQVTSSSPPCLLSPGQYIGAEVLLSQPVRPFSLKAVCKSTVLRLNYTDFDQVSMSLYTKEKRDCVSFLGNCVFFSSLTGLKTQRVSRAVERYEYPANTWLYKPGEREMSVYIVKEGRVEVQLPVAVGQGYRWPVAKHAWEVSKLDMVYNLTLKVCNRGEFFGEYEMDAESKRKTGAKTVTRTVCYVLPRERMVEVFTAKEISDLKAFGGLVIPPRDECESLVLKQFKAHKDYHQALITATSVDSSFPGARDSILDKRTRKMQKWIVNLQSRSQEKEHQVRQGIVKMRKDRIVVRSIDTLVATRGGSQEPM